MIRMPSNSLLRINACQRRGPQLFHRRQSGFTLVELIAILGVISVIIGVLLPAVQKNREAFNKAKSQRNLIVIKNAQKSFFDDHGRFSTSFAELGLDRDFPCSDPDCMQGQNGGYLYQLALGRSDQEFAATAVPAVIGKTGSAKCVIDHTSDIWTCAPIAEADAARQQMFANIRGQAIQTMFQLLLERTPSEVLDISRGLESPDTLPSVSRQIDTTGDGQVTIAKILNYQGIGADVLSDFLALLARELELGTAGENVDELPGVTIADLQNNPPPNNLAMLEGNIIGLAVPAAVGSPHSKGNSISLPAAQLGGFGAGDVNISWHAGQQETISFSEAVFSAQLQPDDSDHTTGEAGTFTLTDQQGNFLRGILIGLVEPASGGLQNLQSLIVGTESGGVWSPAVGDGGATIAILRSGFDGPFSAQFHVVPAVQH